MDIYKCIKNVINYNMNKNLKCPICNTDINKDSIEVLIHNND